MDLLLQRELSTDISTIGRLYVDGQFQCFTLEDVVREGPKLAHETAIPAGRYRVVITPSERFGRMLPLLVDVPDFTGIRIHPGNTAADTSGCILVGGWREMNRIGGSQLALAALQPKIAAALARNEDCWIEIRHADEPAATGG